MLILGYQKNGAFHTGIQKNRAIHILFVEKSGPIIYLAALKKGAIRHEHPYYAIYRKLLPPPHPLEVLSNLVRSFEIQRPRTKPHFPKWDLALVLTVLVSPPFEPLESCDFKELTLKTVFSLP